MRTFLAFLRSNAVVFIALGCLPQYATTAFAGVNEDFIAAVKSGDVVTVKGLLSRGAAVNAKADEGGRTALILASERGYTEIAIILLAKGADANARYNMGQTALMAASSRG